MNIKTIIISGAAVAIATGLTFGVVALAQTGAPTATVSAMTDTQTPTATPTPTPTAVATTAAPAPAPIVSAAPAPVAPKAAAPAPSASPADPVTGLAAPVPMPNYVPANPQPVIPSGYAGFTAAANPSISADGTKSYMLYRGCQTGDTICETVGSVIIP